MTNEPIERVVFFPFLKYAYGNRIMAPEKELYTPILKISSGCLHKLCSKNQKYAQSDASHF